MYALRAQPLSNQDVLTGRSIRVAPSRPRIDGREPTVGFHITAEQPFAELIVATRPELFAGEAASQRSGSNYYASRDQGLSRGPGDVVVMLPAAVVSAMVSASPPAQRLYYLAIGYSDEQGNEASHSVPRERWATDLPFVEVETGLDGHAIAKALGLAIEQLSRATAVVAFDRGRAGNGAANGAVNGGALGAEIAAGFDAPNAGWRWDTQGTITPVASASFGVQAGFEAGFEAAGDPASEEDDLDSMPDDGDVEADAEADAQGFAEDVDDGFDGVGDGDELDYDDGFGGLSHGQTSAFGPNDSEPEELPDHEALLPYGDEADESGELGVSGLGLSGTPAPAPALSAAQQNAVIDAIAAPVSAGGASLYDKASIDGAEVVWGVLRWKRSDGGMQRVAERAAQAAPAVYQRIIQPQLAVWQPGGNAVPEQALAGLRAAGGELREVQRELARSELLAPLMGPAGDLGIASMRGLAVLGAVALALGVEDALSWTLAGIGPAPTEPTLQAALKALGMGDVASFQRAQGLPETGALDARTHARLARALRDLGDRSPSPVRSGAQAVSALVRHAAAEQRGFAAKLERLVTATELEG